MSGDKEVVELLRRIAANNKVMVDRLWHIKRSLERIEKLLPKKEC